MKNLVHQDGDHLSLVCTDPTTPASGDPVRIGDMVGVAVTAERTDGTTTVLLPPGAVVSLSVKGVDGSGNSAVAIGDTLYYVDADTPKVSKKTAGKKIGYALEAITSGSTATIKVKLAN